MGQRRQGIISLIDEMGWWNWTGAMEEARSARSLAGTGGQHGERMVEELLTAGEPRCGTAEEGDDSAEDGQTSFDYVVNIRTGPSKKRA